jgi:hypothetical protein
MQKQHRPHYTFLTTLAAAVTTAGLAASCTAKTAKEAAAAQSESTVQVPAFQADSAYAYIARQLEFGPRVPGSEAQTAAAEWLIGELQRHGAEVHHQTGTVTAYDGTRLPIHNIVGCYNPQSTRRVLLLSHWDSRHVADHDADPAKRRQPVPAANDGASGVGVLLELARLMHSQAPAIGVDLLLVDAEDYGAPEDWTGEHSEEDWALGTQYWCREPHVPGYQASYGILLDMVGGRDATFFREYFSEKFAGSVVDHIWKTAARLGYGKYFRNKQGGAITDDHYFVNLMAGIPTADIIHTDSNSSNGSFYEYWHTTDDTLDKISRETLRAVGETITHIIYE